MHHELTITNRHNTKNMKYLIGIDDTDNINTKGTGSRVRQLAEEMAKNNLCKALSITRHQLYVHKDIPYTSHNSSACLEIDTENIYNVIEFSRDFLIRNSADGSDAGLCIANFLQINDDIINWGNNAKIKILTMEDAYSFAKKHNIFLEGLTGEKTGIIGSLAAIGLRANGNDGRFLMLGEYEIREINGIYTKNELQNIFPNLAIFDLENNTFVAENKKIFVGEWMRPVLRDGKQVLLVNQCNNEDYSFIVKDKEFIKSISS